MAWGSTWRSEWEGIESGDPGIEISAIGRGDVAYIHVPSTQTGGTTALEITGIRGAVFLFHPEKAAFPGTADTSIDYYAAVGETDRTTVFSLAAGTWMELDTLDENNRLLIVPYPAIVAFNIGSLPAAGAVGLIRAEGR
jgi:hypothetical protein